ncbi:MAG: PDZ domain-containing protein [bacterium]|nr:PDZ domain-containing protein [bacterium]
MTSPHLKAILGALTLFLAWPAGAEDPFLRRTATVGAVEKVGPAVVNITTEQIARRRRSPFRGDPFFDRFFRDFSEPRLRQRAQSLGSGVVIDDARHVLTNEHVVARADVIRVTLADGREFEAKLVGADPNNDLAVLQLLTEDDIPWVDPGSSGDLMVGEPVIAIGNPFGLSNTVTTGVVSALNRSLRADDRTYHGFLQTDASINPGNSGGPLLNANGQLIGVNTAIYGGGAQGIGFAIPIDVAKRIVAELITKGEVTPVWLGLDLQDLDPRLPELLSLPERMRGAVVSRVRDGGPSTGSGLARSDVITHVDGTAVGSARELYEILGRSTPGQVHQLEAHRDGTSQQFTARAEEIPAEAIGALSVQLLGLGLSAGEGHYRVETVREGSGAARVGFEPGDRILAIGGRVLENESALRRAVIDLRGKAQTQVVVTRGQRRYHLNVPLS